MKSYIPSLTPLRGVAALIVAIMHFNSFLPNDQQEALTFFGHFLSNGYLMVDFFFLLSGFIMTHVYGAKFETPYSFTNYKQFIFARFARIYPLHFFMLSVFIALEVLKLFAFIGEHGVDYFLQGTSPYTPFSGAYSIRSLITNIFLVQSLDPTQVLSWNNVSWSISTEWQAYLIFPLLLPFITRANIHWRLFIVIIAFVCLYTVTMQSKAQLDIAGLYGLVRCVSEFFLGVIIYKTSKEYGLRRFFKNDLVLLTVVMYISILMIYDIHDLFIIPGFALLLIAASENKGLGTRILNCKILNFLGDVSYSIYMVHYFILILWRFFSLKVLHSEFGANFTSATYFIAMMFYLAMVITFAYLTYRYVEVPMRTRLKSTKFAHSYVYNPSKV
jgi:peptidoglycan/LPS O-acetylase OafA/YrhL